MNAAMNHASPSVTGTPSQARSANTWIVAVALLLALAILPPLSTVMGGKYLLVIGERVMIFAIAALALDLIVGFGAMISMGHAASLGVGAYAAGILASHGYDQAEIGLPAALLASLVFSLATGAIAVRTKGAYFIMITLAFGQMAYFVATSLAPYGGDDGLTLAHRSTVLGAAHLKNETIFFYGMLACLAGTWVLLRAVIASRFGRVLRGLKQNPERMRAIGFNPYPYLLTAYCLAGTIGGLAGFLLLNQAEFVAPAYMSWQRSGEILVIVLVGGVGTLQGALLGAVAYLTAEEVLSHWTEHWKIVFGPLITLTALYARGGLMRFLRWGGGRT
jgi:branched-chain amino acid transport system permease protein